MSYDLCRDRTDGTVDGEPGGTAGLRSGGARGQLLVGGQGAGTPPLGGQQADTAAGGTTGRAPLQPHHAPPDPDRRWTFLLPTRTPHPPLPRGVLRDVPTPPRIL